MSSLQIILPFRLPTWNQLLAMNPWERKKVRDWIKDAVYMCIAEQTDWQTKTDVVLKLQLTDYALLVYSQMIVPNSSKKYRIAKKR